jgi:hypothetical protein
MIRSKGGHDGYEWMLGCDNEDQFAFWETKVVTHLAALCYGGGLRSGKRVMKPPPSGEGSTANGSISASDRGWRGLAARRPGEHGARRGPFPRGHGQRRCLLRAHLP